LLAEHAIPPPFTENNELTSEAPIRTRGGLIAIAAAAGVLAGAVAVYVSQSGDGNVALTAADCADALTAAARAAPFAKGEVAAFRFAKAADPLDDLQFFGPDGKWTGISDLAGKTLLVNFWATWCVPCRAEMPTLDRLAAARDGNDFQVVAVDLDVSDAAKRAPAFLAEIGVEHLPFYSDASLAVLNAIKKRGLAIGLPTTLLVDPRGCRIGAIEGPAAWDSPEARALIDAAVAGPAA
jgi:thiol-disulfide isomerase/thioredoxin